MSLHLLRFANDFAQGNVSACDFVNRFIEQWKVERDNGTANDDSAEVSECLSTIFCLADLFNPEHNRDEYELDGNQLSHKVQETLATYHLTE